MAAWMAILLGLGGTRHLRTREGARQSILGTSSAARRTIDHRATFLLGRVIGTQSQVSITESAAGARMHTYLGLLAPLART